MTDYTELVKALHDLRFYYHAHEAADTIEKLAVAIAESYARDCITEDEVCYCPYCGARMDKDNNGKSES